MSAVAFAADKIVNLIVGLITIDVMYHLRRKQKALKVLFHNKPMLRNVSLFCGVWVLWSILIHISFTYVGATPPFWIAFAASLIAFVVAIRNVTTAWRFVKHNSTGFAGKIRHMEIQYGLNKFKFNSRVQ